MRALVIGATGGNAGHVVPELLRRGVDVRALVRSEQKAVEARERHRVLRCLEMRAIAWVSE